jgi:Cu(I)/Ag(I) efflux system membrane fusion protein
LKQTHSGYLGSEALVSIGSKKVVLSKKENGFKAREIKTGIELNDFIQVLEGLDVKEALLTMHNI